MASEAKRPPCGLWPSPVTPKFLAQGLRLSDVAWDSDGQTLVWLEGRSDRGVLVAAALDGNAPRDLTSDLSVRAKVGYGGGDFCVSQGRVIFSSGGRLYVQRLDGGRAALITPGFGDAAAPALSPDGRAVLYVYSYEGNDGLAVADAEGKLWPRKVAEGHDFYMQPRWSPDGKLAAWVAWDHPNMPWDGSRVYVADVQAYPDGLPLFRNERALAGGDTVAVCQPEFSPDGRALAWLADEGGWHNLYLHDLHAGTTRRLTDERAAQLGGPAWAQGLRTYGWSHDGAALYAVRNAGGVSGLWRYDAATGRAEAVEQFAEYTDIQQPAFNPRRAQAAAVVSSGRQPPRVVVSGLDGGGASVVRRAVSETVPPESYAAPKPVTWRGADGAEVHGLLYVPASAKGGPAIVRVHGGPTSQARAAFGADIQFFATRGYVVLEVNYRGSSGYGRAYIDALRGAWGVHDVADVVSGAKFLVAEGLADPRKLIVMGGSAGGYTVLRALVTHPGFFKAAVCLYGISNLFTLAADTHKFEARYLDSLLGPLPQAAAVYRERSPVFHAEKIVDPLAIFQGEIDEVVPRAQAEAIVESLTRRGVPHEYHVYAGEGHGWRKAETIETYYASVEKFLRQHVLYA